MRRLLIALFISVFTGCGNNAFPAEYGLKSPEAWEKELKLAPAYTLIEFKTPVPVQVYGGGTRFAILCGRMKENKELVYALVSQHTYCGNASWVNIQKTAQNVKHLTLPTDPFYQARHSEVMKDAIGLDGWMKGHPDANK